MTMLELMLSTAIKEAGEFCDVRLSVEDAEAILEVVKEKDAKEVEIHETDEWYCPVFACPDCKAKWMSDEENTHYCPNCGRAVKIR